jgi:hypothetical protein
MSTDHWFVDETKDGQYRFVVVSISAERVGFCRVELAKLRRPGQNALHFKLESPATRERAYRVIAGLPIRATIVAMPVGLREMDAREKGLRHIARSAIDAQPQRIVIERDASIEKADRRWINNELMGHPAPDYQHLDKNSDSLLWLADGIAWAVQRGGRWRSLVDHLIVETVNL